MIINSYRYAGAAPELPVIAGIELHYDSSDISTLWTDDGLTQVSSPGDLVYRWDDKSGNGGHAKNGGTSTLRPTYQTTGLSFDGADWLDNTLYVPNDRPMTAFVVFKKSVSGSGTLLGIVNGASDQLYSRLLMRGSNTMAYSARATGESFAETASTYDDGNTHVITGMETSTTRRDVWVDGGDTGSDTQLQGSFAPTVISIGRLSDSSPGSYWTGYIMEVAMYDSALGTTDRQSFEAYATAKWGI